MGRGGQLNDSKSSGRGGTLAHSRPELETPLTFLISHFYGNERRERLLVKNYMPHLLHLWHPVVVEPLDGLHALFGNVSYVAR
jgi:hypothetical protein